MNFLHLSYLPGLLLAIGVFGFIVVLMEKRFFRLVKTYWFYKRSIFSYLSTFFFLSGFSLLLLALLDARGPEERIKTPIPKDRTIILIDTSASMLAEDVGPSRLQKAALIAKHFARKAAGHQIAIVAFAEIQKKIVPFTNDLDLIDSRLESIKFLKNQNGSSAVSQAIQESLQYFKESGGESSGNILVLTDGEETSEGINLKIPKEVHVALVGIGTTNGGRIPLDDSRNGIRFGYKKSGGQDVITKLNEKYFKAVAADIHSSKYWIANSYSLPSDEILDFFKSEKSKATEEQDLIIRPVMMEWIVVPALVLLCFSYLSKFIRIFSLLFFLIYFPAKSEEPNLSPEIVSKMQELQKGNLNQLEKIKLADDLYKAGAKPEALSLYQENLPLNKIDKSIPPEAYLNYGTALLENKKPQEGLKVYQNLHDSLPANSPITEIMDKNVVSYFRQQEQQKKKQKEKQDKKESENKQDQNGDSGQDQKPSSGKQDQQKKQGQSQEPNKDEKDKSNKDKKEDENKDDQNDEQKKDQNKESERPLPPQKIPAKLKQLMSDDRQLQMRLIENGTRDLNKRRNDRKVKDW
ncbi:MAG: VWA domain-containing protein [Bacteriovoracaceae bacterium]